ncbi:MAG: GNAT family N-acetyltransferase [Limisphaerales bacterium]
MDSFARFFHYVRAKGVLAALKRLRLSWTRLRAGGNRMVLFFCSLPGCDPAALEGPVQGTVERKNSRAELDEHDFSQIIGSWNATIAGRRLQERFGRGATLWLYKVDGKLAGYGWSVLADPMEPHYHPLGFNDAHLFDFFVFPEYRGRRVNPQLVLAVLRRLKTEGRDRAFIEAAEWNTPQLHSLGRTPFVELGRALKYHFFGRPLVLWTQRKPASKPNCNPQTEKESPSCPHP